MKSHILVHWMLVTGSLLLAGCPEAPRPESPRRTLDEPSAQLPAANDLSPNASGSKPAHTWRKDGRPIVDTDTMKSKDGFGAQLFLTESDKFFDDWNKPETPKLPLVQEACRNVPIFTAILFVDPATDNTKRAKVTCHVIVRKPDGTIYGEDDLVGWNGNYVVPPHNLQLAQGRMGIRIEPEDPAGIYTVEASVRDDVKNVELQLKTSFKVTQ